MGSTTSGKRKLGAAARSVLESISEALKADLGVTILGSSVSKTRERLLKPGAEFTPPILRKNLGKVSEAVVDLLHDPDPSRQAAIAKFETSLRNELSRHLALQQLPGTIEEDWLADVLFREDPGEVCNPFFWRKAITDPDAFHGRERELTQVLTAVQNSQPMQIVGPRRIGKTSLLLEVERRLIAEKRRTNLQVRSGEATPSPTEKRGPGDRFGTQLELRSPSNVRVAQVDMMNAAFHTLAGWLKFVGRSFGWEPPFPEDHAGFSERVFDDLADSDVDGNGATTIRLLCLDECEKFTDEKLAEAFDLEFFENLRSLSSGAARGFCILTASRISLKEIREQGGRLSPYYNTFQRLSLGEFDPAEAAGFFDPKRAALRGCRLELDEAMRKEIDRFAGCHPLKLQLAGHHLVEAQIRGDDFEIGLRKAEEDAREVLPEEVL